MNKHRFVPAILAAALLFPVCVHGQPTENAPCTAPSVSAQSAVVMEASSGDIIYAKDADAHRLIASTTKIMTALLALEGGDLHREVVVSPASVGVEGSSIYLQSGEKLTLEDLVYALMLESANDAATAIAIAVAGSVEAFAERMNEKAAELGMTNSHFTNPHGLDHAEHYSCATDMAKLTAYALQNDAFRTIVSTRRRTIPLKGSEGTRVLLNHNRMLASYPGAIGVKTGFTKKSGRCLVSAAERNGVTIVAVTLSAPDDWRDHTALLNYGFSLYTKRQLAAAGEFAFSLPCAGGTSERVHVENIDSLARCMRQTCGEITHRIELPHIVMAPVQAGDVLGQVKFFCGEEQVGALDLTVTEDVPAREIKQGLWRKICDWFH